MNGRRPKLSPREQDTLIYRYTTGASARELQQQFSLSEKALWRYIHGDFKRPTHQLPSNRSLVI